MVLPAPDQVEILLAEDDPQDAGAVLRMLRKSSSTSRVHWVRDGAEALDYLFGTAQYAGRDPARAPKLVLLDFKMPKVDGIEVVRRLKGSALRDLPVVVMPSSDEERGVLQSYRLGVAGYLVKPLKLEALLHTVSSIGL